MGQVVSKAAALLLYALAVPPGLGPLWCLARFASAAVQDRPEPVVTLGIGFLLSTGIAFAFVSAARWLGCRVRWIVRPARG